MNRDKLLKFMDSMVTPTCLFYGLGIDNQMSVIRNMEMQMFGNIVVKYLIFLLWLLSSMDPCYVYMED